MLAATTKKTNEYIDFDDDSNYVDRYNSDGQVDEIPECNPNGYSDSPQVTCKEDSIRWDPAKGTEIMDKFHATWSVFLVKCSEKGLLKPSLIQVLGKMTRSEGQQLLHDALNHSHYNINKAIRKAVKRLNSYKVWGQEDVDKFKMGIKKYGKNFQLIRDTFLTDYRTNEVVKFYYSWKHTSDAKNHTNAQGKRYAKVKRTRKHCPVVLVDENGMIPEKMMLRSAVRKARKARSRTSPLQKRASSRSAKQSHSKPVPKTPLAERAT